MSNGNDIARKSLICFLGLCGILGIFLCVIIIWAMWGELSQGPEKQAERQAERLEQNIRRFDWASPECVEQEVGSGKPQLRHHYRYYEINLRFCELEKRFSDTD